MKLVLFFSLTKFCSIFEKIELTLNLTFAKITFAASNLVFYLSNFVTFKANFEFSTWLMALQAPRVDRPYFAIYA